MTAKVKSEAIEPMAPDAELVYESASVMQASFQPQFGALRNDDADSFRKVVAIP